MDAADSSRQPMSKMSGDVNPTSSTSRLLPSNPANGNQNETCQDDETDDEYCVYTYKGDSRAVADLPSSFFTFDQGDSLSSADESCGASALPPARRRPKYNGLSGFNPSASASSTTHHHASNGSVVTVSRNRVNGVGQPVAAGDLFSPDMDFLEMDFDPGGFGDDEEDYHSDSQDRQADMDLNNTVWNFGQHEEIAPGTSAAASSPMRHEVDVTDGPTTNGGSPTHRSNSDTSNFPATPTNSEALSEDVTKDSGTSSTSYGNQPCSSRTLPPPTPTIATSAQPHCSRDAAPPTHFQPGSSHLNPQLQLGPPEPNSATRTPSRHLMMRLVKSSTLPEMRSQSVQEVSSTTDDDRHGVTTLEVSPRISRNQCFSNSDPLIKNEPLPCYRAVINTSPKSSTDDDSIELEVGGVMIWSEQEACQRSLTQIGTSACGATAVCNVLKALGFDHIDSSYVNYCVKTRLRANSAEIPEYLFSRSVAGAAHDDLLEGAVQVSNGLVNGRFFQPKPGIDAGKFCKWLLHWICKGAVPVVTRNMQVLTPEQVQEGQQIPDAWHHQMIFGISPDKIFLTNPVERESPSAILPQLTSPSVLLVRRSDILDRKKPTTDLRQIMRHPNPEWNELNVLGQVANILLEEIPVFSSNSIAKRIRTTHVTIPAGYKGGVTLFMPTNSPFFPLLLVAPDL